MGFKPGSVLCYKTTGELVMVLNDQDELGFLTVRRPLMLDAGKIEHSIDKVYDYELETTEEHLRREGKEMILKSKIQQEMLEELDNLKKRNAVELVN